MKTSPTRAILLAGAATLSLSVAAYASEFSRVIVFGDRLVDAGQYVDSDTVFSDNPDEEVTTDGRGRFTNRGADGNTGHTWATLVSRNLGHGDTNPNQPQTLPNSPPVTRGTNYAAGFNDSADILDSINGTSVINGIRYSNGSEVRTVFGTTAPGLLNDPDREGWAVNSIVLMTGGARDIRSLADLDFEFDGSVTLSRSGLAEDQDEIEAVADTAADRISTGAILLRDAGAGLVVVTNLIDVGAIPEAEGDAARVSVAIDAVRQQFAILRAQNPGVDFDALEAEALAPYQRILANPEVVAETRTAGTDRYNAELANSLDGQDNIILIDQNALFAEIQANPARFGLSEDLNARTDCLSDTVLQPCNQVDGGVSDHLFENGLDLTTTAHAMLAQQVSSVISAPVQVSGLPFTAIASGREVANAGLAQVSAERIERKGWAPFVSAGIGSSTWNDISGEGRHGSLRLTGVAGATYHLGNGFSVGAAASYQDISNSLSGTNIEIEGSSVYGTVFAGADIGNLFGTASVTVGSVDYDDVNRVTQIGAATIQNSGETDGDVFGASLEVGYRALKSESISAGPIASIDHWSADIGAYDEGGWAATAVNFDSDIDGDSTRASLGLFLEGGDLNDESIPAVFRVKALYTREFDSDPITVSARTQTSPNNRFSREGRGAQEDSLTIGAQLTYDFGPVIGSLNYNVRVGEADDHSGSIDFSVPLGGK